jgi:DNA-binding transcriptional regulator YiaG
MDKTKRQRTQATTSGRRERHSARARAQLLEEYRASGLTQERFAARAGLKVGTLRAWIYKRRPPAPPADGHFAPVRIVDVARPVMMSPGTVTVRWPQGLEVEIAVKLDDTGALRLIRELVAPCLR